MTTTKTKITSKSKKGQPQNIINDSNLNEKLTSDQETQTDADSVSDDIPSDPIPTNNPDNKSKDGNQMPHGSPFSLHTISNAISSQAKNIKGWTFFFVCIFLISKGNFLRGLTTFGVILLLVYWVHWESHATRNWFSISHHYHHDNNNWFSHVIQIILELQFGLLMPIINEFLFDNIFDKWVIIMLYLFYTSVHNINYSIFHVNRTHELHHKDIFTNIGPDICDISFGTKNETNMHDEGYIEDTDHYIANIIISTIIVLILKKLYKYPLNKLLMNSVSYMTIVVTSIIIAVTNTCLMCADQQG